MTLTTQRDLIRAVAARWRKQYEPFTNEDKTLFSARNGYREQTRKKPIAEKLDALDKETATAADVAAIIGNESWTRLACDECGKDTDAVLTVGQKPDHESRGAALCRSCVERAYSISWMNVNMAGENQTSKSDGSAPSGRVHPACSAWQPIATAPRKRF